MPTTTTSSPRRAPSANSGKPGSPGAVPIKTLTFDSAGPRKYALQLAKAGNGNPCLKLVEGVPQPDGTYRKFSLLLWSEDFDAFFNALDAMRAYIKENGIRTPPGHKYDPDQRPSRPRAA